MSDRMNKISARLGRFIRLAGRDDGAETIEWIALAAVLALTLAAVMAVLAPGGSQIGSTILSGIMSWASKIGGGG